MNHNQNLTLPGLPPLPPKAARKQARPVRLPGPTPPPLWTLIVAQLDLTLFEYKPRDIAALMGINVGQVRHYCHQVWPEWEGGQYLMEFDQAVVLIYRIARDARKLPDRAALFERLKQDGAVDEMRPKQNERVVRGLKAIQAHRSRLKR